MWRTLLPLHQLLEHLHVGLVYRLGLLVLAAAAAADAAAATTVAAAAATVAVC